MAARFVAATVRNARSGCSARLNCVPARSYTSTLTWRNRAAVVEFPEHHLMKVLITPSHQFISRLSTSNLHMGKETSVIVESLPTDVVDTVAELAEPTFQSLGIGGFFNPIGIFQELMQFVHVDMGLTWFSTIIVSTAFVKLVMFPLSLSEQWNRRKLFALQPRVQEITMEMSKARKLGDETKMAEMSKQLTQLYKDHRCHPAKGLINQTAQISAFVFFLLAVKGLADVPIESLRTGGVLWFQDLLAIDPFYILPISCAAMISLKIGHDLKMPLWKSSIIFFPCFSLVLAKVPAAGLLYAVTSVVLYILESVLLKSKYIQQKLNLPQGFQYQTTAGKTGFIQEFKDGFWSARSRAKLEAQKSSQHNKKSDNQCSKSEEMFDSVRNKARRGGVSWKRRRHKKEDSEKQK